MSEAFKAYVARRKAGWKRFHTWEMEFQRQEWVGKTFEEKAAVLDAMLSQVRERHPEYLVSNADTDGCLRRELSHDILTRKRWQSLDQRLRRHE